VQTLGIDRDLTLWFFTDARSEKAFELRQDFRLSLGYAQPRTGSYLAISGTGALLTDRKKAAELWTLEQRAYFPNGPGDARLALLKVRVERAEYWLSPGRTAHLFAAAKGAITGKPMKVVGKNVKIPPAHASSRSPAGRDRVMRE
jgi:general stress protein 26